MFRRKKSNYSMKFHSIILIFIIRLLVPDIAKGQEVFRVLFYNVENFFDTENNPEKSDDDFTPEGIRHWTNKRHNLKLQQIAKVILSASDWNPPAIIGLCEVENESILKDLTEKTPLRNFMYEYRITDGNDVRGINVAILYRRDIIRVLNQENIDVFTGKRQRPTRQILYLNAQTLHSASMDIFTVHFPSKYGGEKETEDARLNAASMIKEKADSIMNNNKESNIIIMGDFNDTPQSRTLTEGLKAKDMPEKVSDSNIEGNSLYNLFTNAGGTHKYQGNWSQIDHIIVNTNIIYGKSRIKFIEDSNRVHSPSFLLKADRTWKGKRPFRTYYGYKYEGGFSDHLPVMADFVIVP